MGRGQGFSSWSGKIPHAATLKLGTRTTEPAFWSLRLQLLKPTRQQEKPLQGLGLAHTLQPSTAPVSTGESQHAAPRAEHNPKNKPRWSCLCPPDCGGTRFSKSGLVGLGSQVFLVSCGSSPFRIKSISWSVLISSGTRYDNEQEKRKKAVSAWLLSFKSSLLGLDTTWR